MTRCFWLLLTVALTGCSVTPPQGAVSFVLNQQATDKGNAAPGKSYDLPTASLRLEGAGGARKLIISGGGGENRISIEAAASDSDTLASITGKSLPVTAGTVEVAHKSLQFATGTVTLQAVNGKLGRGNFNARVKDQQPPWEAIGNFEALTP